MLYPSYMTPASLGEWRKVQSMKRRPHSVHMLQSSRESRQALAVPIYGEPSVEDPVPTPPGLGEENTQLPSSKEFHPGHCYFLMAAEMFFSILGAWPGAKPALKVHWLSAELHLPHSRPASRGTTEPDPSPCDDFLCSIFCFSTEIAGVICFNTYFLFFAH